MNTYVQNPAKETAVFGKKKPFHGKIYRGDCVHVLKSIPSKSIDLVVTDPPYVVRYRDRNGRTIPNDGNFKWLRPAFSEVARVLKPDAFCVSFYGWANAEKFLSAWKAFGLRPVGHLVWVKSYSPSTGFVEYRHEAAYVLAKGNPHTPKDPLPDVLRWKYSGNELHPNQKAVTNMGTLVRAFSRKGEIVLDPFMGSGSTMEAAHRCGRRFVGVELDAEYFQSAKNRLRNVA